jgi:hypothetical protein
MIHAESQVLSVLGQDFSILDSNQLNRLLKNPRWLRCCPALTWVGGAVMLAWYDIPSKCWIQTLTYD